MASKYLNCLVVVIVVAIIAAVATYYATPKKAAGNVTKSDVQSYLTSASEQDLVDVLSKVDPSVLKKSAKLKAGFIYVGPIGDYGWTHAHDRGRKIVEEKFPWLETVYVESVSLDDAPATIDRLVDEEKCDVIFTTSFDFMDPTLEAAKRHPNTIFMHCSGYKRAENMGTYFADFYQIYYLNGLMAGALTKSNKLGYVGAYPIPEVVRHINAFALGAKEVNPEAKVYVRWINDWYNPTKAKEAADSLMDEGVDVLAFTEDSPTVIQEAEARTDAGHQVYVFSHYSPMQKYGPNSCVSGQLVHWESLYEEILSRIYAGAWDNRDYDWLLAEGGVELGAEFGVPVNPKFVPALKAVKVQDPVLGEVSVYDLVMHRLNQMKDTNVGYDPFTGPIYDQDGKLRVKEGERASHAMLWSIDWFVDNVVGTIPRPG